MDERPCEVWFYHLERGSIEETLPELLEKTLKRGWRAQVRSSQAGKLADLDVSLWTYRDDSFLPHGRSDERHADRQPILLGTDPENLNGAEALFILDGDPGDLSGYQRCVMVFSGQDEGALQQARGLWARCKSAGHAVAYWRQSEGRGWEKQA